MQAEQQEQSALDLMVFPNNERPEWEPGTPWYDYQLADNGGMGLMTEYGAMRDKNFEALEFITMQIRDRLTSGFTPDEDVVEWAWNFAFYAIDQMDPYMFFHGYTDVVKSDESLYYQFEVREDFNEEFREIDCEYLEYYKLFPEGAIKNFRILYNDLNEKKGLLKNFDTIYDYFHDHVGMIEAEMHEGYYPEEVSFFRRYGAQNAKYLMERCVWAALIWMISPEQESRNWRYSHHPIFQIVYDHRACVLDHWTFYRPGLFQMSERPLKSCAKCGTQEWCVELTHGKEKTEFICQSCLSNGEAFPGMTCGTKMCTALECPNHPAHEHAKSLKGQQKIRQIEAEARYGPLMQLPNGMMVRELPGIIYINNKVIEKTTKSMADQIGHAFAALLESPE